METQATLERTDRLRAVRVGVIGAGIMGSDHAKTLHHSISGAEIVVLADLDRSRAESVAAGIPGLRVTEDPLVLIDDERVDAVVIASHDSTHAELTLACLRANKPVLCEKPLAPTDAECRAVVLAQRDLVPPGEPDLVSVGFMRRFDPGYADLKAAIKGGELGAPLIVHAVCRGVSSGPGTTTESSVTNSAIHDLDVLPWLVDESVAEVSWHAPPPSRLADGFQDPQVMLLRTESGVLCTVEVFLNARYGYDIRCEVVCETGTLSLAEPARLYRDRGLTRAVDYAADWRPRFADAYRLELQAWIDAIRTGAPSSMATAADGLRASVVAGAIHTSMHDGGRPVRIDVPAT